MKKTLLVTILVLTLVACNQKETVDKKVTQNVNQEEISENSQINEENQNQKDEESEENQEIKRTYPKETTEKEVISVEKSTEKVKEENEKEPHNKKDKKDEKSKKKDEKNPDKDFKKNGEKSNKSDKKSEKGLTEDDFFFSYYYLVTIRGGEVINPITDLDGYDDNYYADYVPFSNNIFVLGSSSDNNKSDFSIRKINGKDLTLLYDFKDNEDFRPKGMIGDRIYGLYHDNSESTEGDDKNQSGLAFVDLGTGKLNIFEDTKYENEIIYQVAVTEKEVFFTKFNRDQSTDLYRLDLEKGLDQKAELVEKDTDLNFLFSAKHFENGKAKYEIFKSSDGKIKINDIEYNINDGTRFIGENIITSSPVKFDDVNYLFKIDVINYITGEVVEKDLETYGYRVANGKFYYIDYDKKIKTLDIGL